MKKMIDLHMHIIPEVDDGAENLKMAEQMLRMAIKQGVEVVFATSHSMAYLGGIEHTRTQYRKLQKMIKDKALPIKVCMGCEVLCDITVMDGILRNLETGKIPSLNGTKYVLTEMYYGLGEDILYYTNQFLEKGFIPVIAHAERLPDLTLDIARKLKETGCLIQINAYSIAEEENIKTKARAHALLDNKLVDFIGSDAHRMNHRPPAVAEGIKYLYAHYDEEYVDDILYNNAKNLLLAEEMPEDIESNIWTDGIMGVIAGDALGVPVQFLDRAQLKEAPVTEMDGFGSFRMPVGSWSDDGSMTLATLDSIREKKGIDYDDIMERFIGWNFEGQYTPTGKAYDQGATCMEAIYNYIDRGDYKTCGKTGEYANGNGGLMRIMPVCLYAYVQNKNGECSLDEAIAYVHQATALTHNHLRAKIASGIYFFMTQAILDEEETLAERLQVGIHRAKEYYTKDIANLTEWARFGRLFDLTDFAQTDEADIRSSGYVLDSIEAAVWSLITTETMEAALLKAVNLGSDTDTVAAIAGGLAGLYYGYNQMPAKWKKQIMMCDEIVALCELTSENFCVRK